jgi:hypothetical protein
MLQVKATIAHRRFELTRSDVEHRLRHTLPEPIEGHFVVVNGRRFPPKQVLSLVTGLDRADFNTHQARHVLRRLGFVLSRRDATTANRSPAGEVPAALDDEAELLRPFKGQWVAQRGPEVLVASSSPKDVLAWLERHNQRADAMFRVPRDEHEVTGIAPG